MILHDMGLPENTTRGRKNVISFALKQIYIISCHEITTAAVASSQIIHSFQDKHTKQVDKQTNKRWRQSFHVKH